MLPSDRYTLVDGPEITSCEFCSTGYLPGLQFVAVNNDAGGGGEDVPAGLIETMEDRGGVVAYRARDSFGRGASTVVLRYPQLCSDCIARIAELIGYGDRQPLLAEVDELREQNTGLRGRLEQSEQELQEAELALRDTAVYQRMLAAGETNGGEAKAGSGKRSRSKGA